jgi:hypothetical protein
LDNAFDLVNRIWRYSGNQTNTIVFMICLKKELLRAYASSSSISVLCVITLWQRSNVWQGQSSVQDKFCSKQTQPLLQTDLRLHTRSCKKSDDIWPSNNIGSIPNFPSLQPCSSSFFKQIMKTTTLCIYLIPWISPYAIDQIKCIIQTPSFSDNNWVLDYDGEWNMNIYVLNFQHV